MVSNNTIKRPLAEQSLDKPKDTHAGFFDVHAYAPDRCLSNTNLEKVNRAPGGD